MKIAITDYSFPSLDIEEGILQPLGYETAGVSPSDAMKRLTLSVTLLVFWGCCLTSLAQEPRFVDHSLLIAPEYPCTWPSHPFPRFAIIHSRTIGPESAYNIDTLLIDGNTGTQLDVPPHSVARPELMREKSGPLGLNERRGACDLVKWSFFAPGTTTSIFDRNRPTRACGWRRFRATLKAGPLLVPT